MPGWARSCEHEDRILPEDEHNESFKWRSNPLIVGNVFSGNWAMVEGGGIRFCFFWGTLPSPQVNHNIIVGNTSEWKGGGICCNDAEVVCENLTIVGNSAGLDGGGGVGALSGTLVLRNCIISGNQGYGILREATCDLTTDYCDVWGNSGGDYLNCLPAATDISGDPEFCDQGVGDYHLYETSCCQGVGLGGVDIGALAVGCFTVPDVVFYNNFSNQQDEDWTVEVNGDAALSVDAGSYLGNAETPGSWVRSVVTEEAAPFGNFLYWVKVKLEDDAHLRDSLDLYLRFTGPEHYYCVRLDGVHGRLYKRFDSHLHLLDEFNAVIAIDAWTSLFFSVIDWELSGSIVTEEGDQLLFLYDDLTSPILSGTVGVGVTTPTGPWEVRFDDVMVAATDSTITSVPGDADSIELPIPTTLQVYPNPFNPCVTVSFSVDQPQRVTISVFNMTGRRVAVVTDQMYNAGLHSAEWNGKDYSGRAVSSGTYLLRMATVDQVKSRKVLLVR